jgi:exodeoxyribonuclease X
MSVLVVDTETTGREEPQIIEIATMALGPLVVKKDSKITFTKGKLWSRKHRPTKPIELGAKATHHYQESELEEYEPWGPLMFEEVVGNECEYLLGHSVDYDWKCMGAKPIRRICTDAICREAFVGLDSYKLGAIAYYLKGPEAKKWLKNAHTAEADVKVLVSMLLQILKQVSNLVKVKTWEDVWAFSEMARVPKIMPFGKHRGVPMELVPRDYKVWLSRQSDVDEYLMKALLK